MSRGDFEDIQQLYDATAVWLRDCTKKGDVEGVKHAEARLRQIDLALANARFEK